MGWQSPTVTEPEDRSSPGSHRRPPSGRGLLFSILQWAFALAAGAGFFAWVAPSLAAAAVVFWYVLESVPMLALLFGPRRGEALRAWVLPRAVGTAVGIALAYLWLVPWDQVVALAYLLLSLLEALYALLRRRRGRAALDRAWRIEVLCWRQAMGRLLRLRAGMRAACAASFVLLFSVALLGHGARQVALDARFYASLIDSSGAYEIALRWAGDAMVDLLPRQDPDVRRAVAGATDQDLYAAAQQLLPRPWTLAVVEKALDATLSWLATEGDRRVPPVTLPFGDVQRHLEDALSLLIDRRAAALPPCPSDAARAEACRPQEMSVAAYVATYKPPALAAVEEALAMIPAELDLATAVTLAPGTFREPLALASEARSRVQDVHRALAWARVGCALSLALLTLLSFGPAHRALRWLGGTLFAAGIGAWLLGLAASLFGPRPLAAWLAPKLALDLPQPLVDLPRQALSAFSSAVYARTWPWALLVCALGLGIACLGIALPSARRRDLTSRDSARILAAALAVGVLLWARYQVLGQRIYDQAALAHRRGQVAEATALYRRVDRLYALTAEDFARRARQGLRECQRFQEANALYSSSGAAWAAAAYEALIATGPVVALRDLTRQRLLESSFTRAVELEQAGEYERALDRYRFILGAYRDRSAQQAIADLHLARGRALQDGGDYRGAIATYQRIAYDVYHPGLWAAADDRAIDAYCAWSTSLRAAGRGAQAVEVCAELSARLDAPATDLCPACEP